MAANDPDLSTRTITRLTEWMGTRTAIALSFIMVFIWGATGPLFGFSDVWQLVINTATTIITYLMVFIIQNTQNRDSRAIHTKLDALLEAASVDDSKLVGLEESNEKDIKSEQETVRNHSAANSSACQE